MYFTSSVRQVRGYDLLEISETKELGQNVEKVSYFVVSGELCNKLSEIVPGFART